MPQTTAVPDILIFLDGVCSWKASVPYRQDAHPAWRDGWQWAETFRPGPKCEALQRYAANAWRMALLPQNGETQ